jgi:hypothetical protein
MIPVGARVRIKESDLDGFVATFRKRVAGGRIGVVTGHLFGYGPPLVKFPAHGRKKEFHAGSIHERYLEIVGTSDTEPAA